MKMQKTRHRHELGWPEWTLLGIVGASTLLILVTVLIDVFHRPPAERARDELQRLAQEYYTTVMYDNLLVDKENDPAEQLESYGQVGVPMTYLRHLLNSGDSDKSREIFEAVGCDTDMTGVRYFPYEPYGREDYTVEYNWHCTTEIPEE